MNYTAEDIDRELTARSESWEDFARSLTVIGLRTEPLSFGDPCFERYDGGDFVFRVVGDEGTRVFRRTLSGETIEIEPV